MATVLSLLAGVAAFAGYKGWPLYSIFLVGISLVIWNLMYFGTASLRIASGGPLAYLTRIFVLNTVQAGAFYAAGLGLKWLIG